MELGLVVEFEPLPPLLKSGDSARPGSTKHRSVDAEVNLFPTLPEIRIPGRQRFDVPRIHGSVRWIGKPELRKAELLVFAPPLTQLFDLLVAAVLVAASEVDQRFLIAYRDFLTVFLRCLRDPRFGLFKRPEVLN